MDQSQINPLLLKQAAEADVDLNNLPDRFKVLLNKVSSSYSTFDAYQDHTKAEIRHRTEQLIASTSKAYSFLDSINRGFIMCDTSSEVVLTNGSFKRILGLKTPGSHHLSDNDLNMTEIDKVFSPELELKNLVDSCLANAAVIEKDNVSFGKGILHLFIAPLLNDTSGTDRQILGVVLLIEDVTEQKLLDRSKDEFLSIASHELRTPLTAIRGNAALLKKYYGESMTDKNMAEMIDDIHESCVRLIGIVNDFLDVSAIEQNKIKMQPAEFSLNDLVSDTLRELEELSKAKGLELIRDTSVESAAPVYADRQRVKQVIINLIGNAIKFTDKGSVAISTTQDDEFVYVDVRDTGKGMDIENQKLLFRKFQQASNSLLTRDSTQGTGLGLYISKHIIELAGGKIELVASEPGSGSTFRFSLPKAKQSA